MSELKRLLLVDDSEDDAFLLLRELARGGLKPQHRLVSDERSLRDALQRDDWDMVITDHNMPGFSSELTIAMTRERFPELPVIIVSGTIGEEVAVNAMKAGAQDYIMKDNLSRLIPAINRELKESHVRKAKLEAETTLAHMAYHDSLTDLLNRREFERRLTALVEEAQAHHCSHAVLYLDLDQFKIVNDTCGHGAGDELLKQIGVILARLVRSDDTLARLGGDEFGVLLYRCDESQAIGIAQSLCEAIRDHRFIWHNRPFALSLSVGLVMIGHETSSTTEILKQADLACYAAKDRGRNNVQVYQEDDHDMKQRQNDMHWTSGIHDALQNGHFLLHQQPMAALQASCGEGLHAEFLVRMRGKEGIIYPGAFIPAAERFGLMGKIDRRVIEMVFQYLDRTGLGRQDTGTYFINLSGTSLGDGELFTFIRYIVQRYRIRPERVCFEITETAAIANLNTTVGFIHDIREDGFKFALDDFGSGMSSFSYLKTLPVDYLKIDGSFVRNLLENPIDLGIVDACNRIGHAAGLKTIAEFVENNAVRERLTDIGLDYAQGFGIARPGPVD